MNKRQRKKKAKSKLFGKDLRNLRQWRKFLAKHPKVASVSATRALIARLTEGAIYESNIKL